MNKSQPGWMWVDLGRVWCLVAEQAATDMALTPDMRAKTVADARGRALVCLERARAVGEFGNPERVKFYADTKAFDPIRDQFDMKKKP